MTDDTRLEREFRDGLRRAAERAEVGVPLAERAHAGARTRRRRRWVVAGAVATVVGVAGVTAVVQSGDRPGSSDRHTATQPTYAPVTDWRPESWHGLTVDVPADWGWGTAPLSMADDEPALLCGGPGAALSPVTGAHGAGTPYVGRPVMLSDACQGPPFGAPEAPYVWLGADIAPGTEELADGYTQETVEAFGTTLTVASQDPTLRRAVLESARATTACEARLPSRPAVIAMPTEGLAPVHAAQVCAYRAGEGGRFDLVYATTLDQATAQSLYDGHGLGATSTQDFCASKFGEYLQVRFSGQDAMGTAELTADWVVDPGCRQVETGPGHVVPLQDKGMEPFSRDGLPVVLRSLIGMLG